MVRCMKTLGLLAFIAGILGVLPTLAWAQSSVTMTPGADQTLSLELNEGRLIHLDSPAKSVFIANPGIADINVRSSRLIYIFGQSPGQTTLFALDSNDQVIVEATVDVKHNLTRLREMLGELVPNGNIELASIDGSIILNGAVRSATDAGNAEQLASRFLASGETIINQLSVTDPNQVNLRVRIAEVSRNILNRFGFNWSELFSSSNFLLGLTTGFPTLESSNFLQGSTSIGSMDINGVIDALANDGVVTILAEPNLTALSGETASFLAGGEFPIPVSQDADTITVEFHNFGVALAFTPTIISENRINIHVRPEVSQLSTAGAVTLANIQIPALTTRRAETTVELASGQSFAIAGLFTNDSQELLQKTPGIGDIPILGALFKSERFSRSETELVIIVTPYIVQPVSAERLALPTDPFTQPPPGAPPKAMAGETALSQTIPVPSQTSSAQGHEGGTAGYILD